MAERTSFEREIADLGLAAEPAREFEGPRPGRKLPLVLAGPIVRRATTSQVWFWFACSKPVKGCDPHLIPYDPRGAVFTHMADPAFKEIVLKVSDLKVVRGGERIWFVLVSAEPKSGAFPTDVALGYDLTIVTEDNGAQTTTKLSAQELKIAYAPYRLPTFVIGELNHNLAHGSCRRPGADAEDVFTVYDGWMSKLAGDAFKRPAALILTGDQIYADDVAMPLFQAVRDLAADVFGYVEQIPNPNGQGAKRADAYLAASGAAANASARKRLTHRTTSPIGFTTDDGEAHLLSFPEYAAMYLAVWNPDLCQAYGVESGGDPHLRGFCRATQACRRVMANTVTYMLCDDHEITDDWNLDQAWTDVAYKNPLGRRIMANGLAAYWAFQAWGNDPTSFEPAFVQAVTLFWEQLRASNGLPRTPQSRSPYNAADAYDKALLGRHWSFMAPCTPMALCVDTRTLRETPAGQSAVLSGKRVWPRLDTLLSSYRFRRGDPLLLVLPSPFLMHRSAMYVQHSKFDYPKERYQGDYELFANNPRQRSDLVLHLHEKFAPSALVIFSGDVHHGFVITGRYAYGAKLDDIKNGRADWTMRIVQITSSPIKNEKKAAFVDKSKYGLWVTDAGNVGESVIPQWEQMYAQTDRGAYIAMQASAAKLAGPLGRETYIFEPHLCVVDMPRKPGANVGVLFIGVKDGRLLTATTTADTKSTPADFRFKPNVVPTAYRPRELDATGS